MGFVYGDISGSDTGVLASGCYLGDERQWQLATEEWKRIQDDAGVDRLHATEFYSAKGAFDSDEWRRDDPVRGMIPGGPRHDALARRMCSCATDAGLVGFAYALDASAFRAILAPELARVSRKHRGDNPRTQAVMSSLSAIGDFFTGRRYFEKGGIQVIFEREQGDGRFIDFFDESHMRRERWTYWFSSFTTVGKEFEPVQIADLLAHEAWREVNNFLASNPRPRRKSFERMLMNKSIDVRWHGPEHCAQNATAIRDLVERYPDGLIPDEDTRGGERRG